MAPTISFTLAGVVLLSLVLPLSAARLRDQPHGSAPNLASVWAGQAGLALAGLLILGTPIHPGWWLLMAFLSCMTCTWALHRSVRAA